MKDGEPCPTCRHPVSMGQCWRLTCPTNGARDSFRLALPAWEIARRATAEAGRKLRTNHPSTWGDPPDPEFML